MNVWDNFKRLTRPYAEEEDYRDDYAGDDYGNYNQPTARYDPPQAPQNNDMEFDVNGGYGASPASNAQGAGSGSFNGRVMNMVEVKAEISIANPKSFDEMGEIMNELLSGHVMTLNMRAIDVSLRRRIVDTVSGCIFAMNGSVTKVDDDIYMFAPKTVKVNNLQVGVEDEVKSYI